MRRLARRRFGIREASGRHLPAIALAALLGGCASGDGPPPTGGRVPQCKAGDVRVASEADCLQDDAACYALASGGFCTGERGNRCPAGSTALPAGAACPGARCFAVGESLRCTVGTG